MAQDSESALPYNPRDKQSIIEYASLLMGSTLREHVDVDSIPSTKKRRGIFGNAVEKYYFMYDLNSDSNPDFNEVGMELKTTPLIRRKKGQYSAKERLVITNINYMNVVNEQFETSALLHKASDILLISYLYEKEKDPLDYIIEVVAEWGLPEEDLDVIKRDWETVVDKVRQGKAHEISGSDTLYLEACTKAADSSVRRSQPFSDIPAKPRAWALKASYMTAVQNKLRDNLQRIKRAPGEEELDELALIRKRFAPYFGKTLMELAEAFDLVHDGIRTPKALTALIVKHILDIDEDAKVELFEKAGIKPKAIRLRKNGRPKEAMSFPRFDYYELAEREFEESDFYRYLQRKYLFVIFGEVGKEDYRLRDVAFWQMPDDDLEEARRCYELMRERVKAGRAEESVKSTENRCCHVRPHGQSAADTLPAPPDGRPVTKKCFWLNQGYLQQEISRILLDSPESRS